MKKQSRNNYSLLTTHYSLEKGSILLMTLVFFLVLVIIFTAWMRFAVRQNNAVVGQEQEEQSFHLSEAGVHYVLHVLNNGVCTPQELSVSEPVIQPVIDESVADGQPVGTYELTFDVTSVGGETVTAVRAVGYDKNVFGECQLIEARVESFSGVLGKKYRILSWDHKSTITCGVPGALATAQC
jgi:Tfp pilus assembly protein PilX